MQVEPKKLVKSSHRFVVSTQAPNNKEFRVLTSGIDISDYPKNPLLLWMHQRPKGKSRDEILPLGNCLDIAIKDGKVYGTPAFDTTDTFAVSIYNKVENGTIRMASAGLLPLEWARDENGDLWLIKSKLVEISLCDIGSNPEALAVKLYNEKDELITLSADYFDSLNLTPKINSNMKLIQLSAPEVLPILGLSEDAKPEEALTKIKELVTLTSTQKMQIQTLTSEKETAENDAKEANKKLDAQIKLANDAKVNGLVEDALKSQKITADQKAHYVKLASADFDSTKALLDSIPANPSVTDELSKRKNERSSEYEKLSWDELDKQDRLITLKADDIELFKAKYKAKFGKEFKEQ